MFSSTGAFMINNRERVVALAAKHTLPASYALRKAVEAGGLMSYGPSFSDALRQSASTPAGLSRVRSPPFEFVVNLKTAKALGLEIPPTLLAIADEVIE